jgi:hypothetical protein
MPSLLPPKYANIPTQLLYNLDLPASARLTAIRIYGLGWRHRYERTDPVSLQELMDICEVGRSTLYGHLATLGDKRVLRYTTVSVGSSKTFVFELIAGTSQGSSPENWSCPENWTPSPEIWTDSAIDAVAVPSSSVHSSKHDRQQQQHTQATHAVEGELEGEAAPSRNLDARSDILDELGIRDPARSHLLAMPHVTHAYLEAWRDWFQAQNHVGIGWVINQLRAAQDSPPATTDRQRYLEWARPPDSAGPYRDFVNT